MIQRIQTIFWFIVAVLFIVMIPNNWMNIFASDGDYLFSAFGVYKGQDQIITGVPLITYLGIMAALNIVIIFLYKKRVLQARLTVISIILTLCFYLLVLMYRYMSFEGEISSTNWNFPLILPVINVILSFLAWRAVVKDEAKVRSLDRLR
ncbi:MAG: DUF4293 domain-containing protein [Bacteroidales bacterium]|nr:DUF4293 domain-containing protein [Bacteroidales bacterium]